MKALLLKVLLYILILIVICVLVLFFTGKGDTFGKRITDAFRKLLRWADIDTQSPHGKPKEYSDQKTKHGEQTNTQDEAIQKIIADLKRNSDKNTKDLYTALQDALKIEFDSLRRQLNEQNQELVNLKEMIKGLKYNPDSQEKHKSVLPSGSHRSFPLVKYGRLVDCNSPLGFMDSNLSLDPVGCCFIIEITSDNSGRYRLVENSDMKKEALQMFNPVISTGCQYDTVPTVINDAINIEDGEIRLYNGVWAIESKNKVKLV